MRLKIFAKDPSIPQRLGALSEVEVNLAGLGNVDPPKGVGPNDGNFRVRVRRDALKLRSIGQEGFLPTDDHYFVESRFSDLCDGKALDLKQTHIREYGVAPATTDSHYAQAMVYAVAQSTHALFERGSGRKLGFNDPKTRHPVKLDLCIDAMRQANAHYDATGPRVCFGYYDAALGAPGRVEAGAIMHTALSHDIIVHELTHAMLDRIHPLWMLPQSEDGLGLHEGLADLIATFRQFEHLELIEEQIYRSKLRLDSKLLASIANEFGRSVQGKDRPLRLAIPDEQDNPFSESAPPHLLYNPYRAPHEHGETLVNAVYGAFRAVFESKSETLRVLVDRNGEIGSREAAHLVARQASRLARQFLLMTIRAIDYMAPVAPTFGRFLRAMLTADSELFRHDPWAYRECLVASFRRFGIPVLRDDVLDLSVPALLFKKSDNAGAFFPQIPKNATLLEDCSLTHAGAEGERVELKVKRWYWLGQGKHASVGGATELIDSSNGARRFQIRVGGDSARVRDYLNRQGWAQDYDKAVAALRNNDWGALQRLKSSLGAYVHGVAISNQGK